MSDAAVKQLKYLATRKSDSRNTTEENTTMGTESRWELKTHTHTHTTTHTHTLAHTHTISNSHRVQLAELHAGSHV